MSDHTPAARIDPDGIYHDGPARLLLGLTDSTMRRARRSGRLRYTRQGRVLIYRGQWILDWLESEAGDSADPDVAALATDLLMEALP